MQSYSGQITASQEAVIKSIVDSAEFDTDPQTAETNFLPTDAFTYTDTKTHTTFLVPANCVETPLTEERESIDVKFTSLKEDGMSIMYGFGFGLPRCTTSESIPLPQKRDSLRTVSFPCPLHVSSLSNRKHNLVCGLRETRRYGHGFNYYLVPRLRRDNIAIARGRSGTYLSDPNMPVPARATKASATRSSTCSSVSILPCFIHVASIPAIPEAMIAER